MKQHILEILMNPLNKVCKFLKDVPFYIKAEPNGYNVHKM